MSTFTESVELSADDVRSLRQATSVSFHTNDEGSRIRASFDDTRGATRSQAELFPQRDGGDRYRDIQVSHEAFTDFYAFAMVHTAQYSRTFKSITRLLRKGNRIAFRWGRDVNTNQLMKEAGLHGDQFDLAIFTNSNYTNPKVFTVETSTSKDNTARMIRNRKGW